MISSKHFSALAVTLVSLVFIGCILVILFPDQMASLTNSSGYQMTYQDKLFDTSEVLRVDIQMEEDAWQTMLDDAMSEEYEQCDVTIGGTTFYSVGIRPKGNTSLSSIANDPDNNRYSFKLEFDQFVDGQTCFGLDKLVLNNHYADATYMKEAVVYDMYQYLGADASLYNYAEIYVNGEYWGVYLALEAIEESFMLRNFGTQKGQLYKPDNMNMGGRNGEEAPQGEMPRDDRQNRTIPQGDEMPAMPQEGEVPAMPQAGELPAMPQGGRGGGGFGGIGTGGGANLNYTDDDLDSYTTIWEGEVTDSCDADHRRVVTALEHIHEGTELENYLDVDNVIKYMAVHSFSVNEDSLSGNMAHNYYLYESGGKLNMLPWDYNLAFGGMNSHDATDVVNDPIDDPFSGTTFFDVLLENEEYKAQYHAYYQQLVEAYTTGGRMDALYTRIRAQIDDLVKNDPNTMFTYEAYEAAAPVLYETVLLRAESVKGQLNGTIPATEEGQRQNASALVDASHIDLSVMGSMGGGRGGQGGIERKEPDAQREIPRGEMSRGGMNDRGGFGGAMQAGQQLQGQASPEFGSMPGPESGAAPWLTYAGYLVLLLLVLGFVILYKRKRY